MPELMIKGGVRLTGEATVSTSKNAVLPIMAASLLCKGTTHILRAPGLSDVDVMCELLRELGVSVIEEGSGISVNAAAITSAEASYEWVQRMRASVLIMGPLLGREGQVRISLPGGCAIGTRPIDLHLKGFDAMGATVRQGAGCIEATASRLHGATIYLDMPSVGATENLMMAGVLAEGVTRIENAAKEPEIVDLANFLGSMGAHVSGAGSDTIVVTGVAQLHCVEYEPIPDRIEAGTLLIAAAATGGNVLLRGARPDHMRAVIAKLREAGARIDEYPGGLRVRGHIMHGSDVKTLVYPGFPTDLQAPMMALLSVARGTSVIIESIFENRFMHINELRRMGARIRVEERMAVIEGVQRLSGARVHATDLRAGAALVIAALCAEGASRVTGVAHIDRGYEGIEKKLAALGGSVERIVRPGDTEAAYAPTGSD